MSYRLCAVILAGCLAAGCTATERTVVVPPAQARVVAVDNSCTEYGYVPGTTSYDICVQREAAARNRGRMAASYAHAAIVADSREACSSYGLMQGTERYENCVRREIAYRSPA
jgi:hypothetical protein